MQPEEYLARARYCDAQASAARSDELRQAFTEVAVEWRRLARSVSRSVALGEPRSFQSEDDSPVRDPRDKPQ